MINFDDEATFPVEIGDWVCFNEQYFRNCLDDRTYSEGWELKHRLEDMRLGEKDFVKNYVLHNGDVEFVVWHATRIENVEQYKKQGIKVMSNQGSKKRIIDLFHRIGLNEEQIEEVIGHLNFYWSQYSRTEFIHFFASKNRVYDDDQINIFAQNLGGECVNLAIGDIDKKLYQKEPYKRLWILGTPSIVKFKCKLRDMYHLTQVNMIIAIIEYFVVTQLYNLDYKFHITGMKIGSVIPEDIIAIDKIGGFIEMWEKYDDYKNFYDELK